MYMYYSASIPLCLFHFKNAYSSPNGSSTNGSSPNGSSPNGSPESQECNISTSLSRIILPLLSQVHNSVVLVNYSYNKLTTTKTSFMS